MAGKIVVKNAVERKAGHLYYVDGNGNVCASPMKSKKATTKKEAPVKEAKKVTKK